MMGCIDNRITTLITAMLGHIERNNRAYLQSETGGYKQNIGFIGSRFLVLLYQWLKWELFKMAIVSVALTS